MGLRRKKILPPLRRRIEELLETRKPGEVFEILQPTRERVSLSAIYKIRRSKSKKVRETGAPQKPLDFPSLLKQLNLPSWINQEQLEHLEGKEQRDERGGMDIITYPGGLGIRQRLEFFRGCFSEINPRSVSFWHPQDEEEIVMIQLRGHLPDKGFWDKVKDFIAKDEEYKILRNRAYERYTSAGEKLAPLEPPGSPPTLNPHITSSWARRVLVRALSPELGLSEHFEYYHHKEKDGDFTLHDEELIYRGPDDVAAERKHRDLVDDFINNHREEFNQTVSLMKNLRQLRQQIFARVDKCLRGRQYSYNYCPDCPADQARKMLAGE
jgi:hypothetical protein